MDPIYDTTSPAGEGQDLSDATKVWTSLAMSECRMELLTRLVQLNIGLKEVQDISECLNIQYRSEHLKSNSDKEAVKVVRNLMELKLRDEKFYHGEQMRLRNIARREIFKEYGKNTRKSRTIVKSLRTNAMREKNIARKKYEKKLSFLIKKYSKNTDLDDEVIVKGLEKYSNAKIFSRLKYEKIERDEITVAIVGDLEISDAEREALTLHPKFGIMVSLEEETDFELDLELGFSKLRYKIS